MDGALAISVAPLLPGWAMAALAAVAVALLAIGAWHRARGIAWRALATAVLWLALLQPSVSSERCPRATSTSSSRCLGSFGRWLGTAPA